MNENSRTIKVKKQRLSPRARALGDPGASALPPLIDRAAWADFAKTPGL